MRKLPYIAVGVLLLGLIGVRLGGSYAAQRSLEKLSKQRKIWMTAGNISSWPGRVTLTNVEVGDRGTVDEIVVRYGFLSLLLFRVNADLTLRNAQLTLTKDDLPKPGTADTGGSGGRIRINSIAVESSQIKFEHPSLGLHAETTVDAIWKRGSAPRASLTEVTFKMEAGPSAGAERIELVKESTVAQPKSQIHGGRVSVWRGLEFSDIVGAISPRSAGALEIALAGSYGGAGGRLWDATGNLDLAGRSGSISVRAERFQLDKLEPVLRRLPLIDLERGEMRGELTLSLANETISFVGSASVSGLTLFGERIGPVAVPNLAAELEVRGSYNPAERRVTMDEAVVKYADVVAVLSGQVDRLGAGPLVTGELTIPPVPCQTALNAIPAALVPTLNGIELKGQFETSLSAKVDFGMLAQLREREEKPSRDELLESVQIDGEIKLRSCRVSNVPENLAASHFMEPFTHIAEIMPGHATAMVIGSDNPDFVRLGSVSPHLTGAILTTEDSRFFDHSGFISRELRTALARNLIRGRFAFGASSITMQTVKNVLLHHQKTLARKLQELILTWYLETFVPKWRIFEIYLNAIEFGPGIYGVGHATRQYFGKHPRDLGPKEAVFLASLLPSPKRRFESYCRDALTRTASRKVDRILKRMNSRERLSDEDYQAALESELSFDRAGALSEQECLKRLHVIVNATLEEPVEKLELPFAEVQRPPPEETAPESVPPPPPGFPGVMPQGPLGPQGAPAQPNPFGAVRP